jgi:hypothetical protein
VNCGDTYLTSPTAISNERADHLRQRQGAQKHHEGPCKGGGNPEISGPVGTSEIKLVTIACQNHSAAATNAFGSLLRSSLSHCNRVAVVSPTKRFLVQRAE